MSGLSFLIVSISAAALGLEIVLMRALSIGHWHHFAHLVISAALLGFGSSGTLISIFQRFFRERHRIFLWGFAVGMGISVPAAFWLSQRIPFDQLQLMWDTRQLFYLLEYYLLFFIPFFFAGACICLAFTVFARKAHRLYFFNMIGSGFGAGGIVALMYGNSPERLLLVISILVFLGAAVFVCRMSFGLLTATMALAVMILTLFRPGGLLELNIHLSDHKSLAYYRVLPEAKILATRYSPLARLDIVQAPAIRHAPGLSFAYQGPIPEQMLIISDADGISAINRFERLEDLRLLDYTTSALPYHMTHEAAVCVLGSGGGSDIAQALLLNASHVTAVEMNPQIIDWLQGRFSQESSNIYGRLEVTPVIAEGRNFLQTTSRRFDIIQVSLLDSFIASGAGLYTMSESHLYTVEAIDKALARLTPDGLLSITRSLKSPPRDSFKMLATVAQTLQTRGAAKPADHIAMIRSWATATIVASPRPLSASRIRGVRKFCRERALDLVHLPGLEAEETNRFHVLETDEYFEGAKAILTGPAEQFFSDYAFNIRPATDDRPYFFDFFKWKALPHMMQSLGEQWLPYSEWGYFILIGNLLQAAGVSTLLILLPLFLAKPVKTVPSGKTAAFGYFLLLGLAYMFLEIGFIQKMTLLIGDPIFGVAVTLSGFLVFSGCGALLSERMFRLPGRRIWAAIIAIIAIGALELTLLNFTFDVLVGFGRAARIVAGLVLCAPLAFFMGMPFPSALAALSRRRGPLVPWAWGINGFASVIAAVLGTCMAIWLGFTFLILTALACYVVAGLISNRLCASK